MLRNNNFVIRINAYAQIMQVHMHIYSCAIIIYQCELEFTLVLTHTRNRLSSSHIDDHANSHAHVLTLNSDTCSPTCTRSYIKQWYMQSYMHTFLHYTVIHAVLHNYTVIIIHSFYTPMNTHIIHSLIKTCCFYLFKFIQD